jgi:toxin ParE1/3/4
MQLDISANAALDLRELHAYGVGKYGAARADAYLGEIFGKFDHFVRWPAAARERFDVQPPVRLSRQRAHNILYTVTEDSVLILRVLHHSVNWIDLL